MPAPSQALSTQRPDLAASLEEFDLQADRQGFIGLKAFPVIEVAKQSGNFGRIPVEQLLQRRQTQRAPGAAYDRGTWTFQPASYATQEHGAEEPVDDREAAMYRDYFDAELVSAQRARDAVLRNHELRIAGALFNPVAFAPNNVAIEWDNSANAVPIDNVDAACKRVWGACGLWPNALIISRHVFLNLRRCAQLVDKIRFTRGGLPGEIGVTDLSLAFDLPYILVGGGATNTAAIGQAANIAAIWDDEYAMVARICTTGDIREPGLGRTFHWSEDGSSIGAAMESYRDETVRSNIIRARMDTDEVLLYTQAADLLGNITT